MFGRVGLALNSKKEKNGGTVGHLGYLWKTDRMVGTDEEGALIKPFMDRSNGTA
jgi:hypothetical protein